MKKIKFPKIKKTISSYILSEEGRISKQALITIGAFLGGSALGLLFESEKVTAPSSSCKYYVSNADSCVGTFSCGAAFHCHAIDVHFEDGHVRGHHSHHASY